MVIKEQSRITLDTNSLIYILATSIVSGSKYLISNDIRLQSIREAENIKMIEISAIE